MKSLRQFAYVSYSLSCFFRLRLIAALVCALTTASAHGQAVELISDGGFEQDGLGWGLAATQSGSWFLSTVGSPTPVQGNPTSANGGGQNQYVVSDQIAPAITALLQVFEIPAPPASVILSFDMFVNDFSGQAGFNTNQFARVDIITANADPFTTDVGVIFNAYLGTDGGPLPNDFTHYEFDITTFVPQGGLYQIRFMQLNNVFQDAVNQGVDNVSISFVPEPGTIGLAGLGFAMLLLRRRRQRRRAG